MCNNTCIGNATRKSNYDLNVGNHLQCYNNIIILTVSQKINQTLQFDHTYSINISLVNSAGDGNLTGIVIRKCLSLNFDFVCNFFMYVCI